MQTYGLDEATLRDLYHNQMLTQAEIASLVGTSQGKISKLLKRWGITRLTKSKRLRLPDLSLEQADVLLGSLLGSGSMNATGATTARFYESHTAPHHNEYVQWKAGVLEPFTAKVFGERGLSFYTHGCQALRPLYDLFYSEGGKVYPSSLHTHLTPRALAVWYMDVGATAELLPRISFCMDNHSRRRATKALRALGFQPVVGPNGITFPKQAARFYETVQPHLPECMAHMVPSLVPREGRPTERSPDAVRVYTCSVCGHTGHTKPRCPLVEKEAKPRAVLTPEKAAELYRGNLPVVEIAKLYGVGVTTVRRRLREVGISPGKRKARGLLSLAAANARLEAYEVPLWAALTAAEQARWVDEIEGLLKHCPFPTPTPRPPVEAREEFNKLVALETYEGEDGTILPRSYCGTMLCAEFFPNRYRASWRGSRTAYECWHMESERRTAIRLQLEAGRPVLPGRVLQVITMRCRTPSVFKPPTALHLYRTFCPEGGKVWDPCSGYGGRMLAAAAAGVQYVGTDVEPETVLGNKRLASYLGLEGIEIIHSQAEEYEPPPVDMVFTSPPYFDVEHYSQSALQSYKRYTTFDGWLEGFLRPVVQSAAGVLDSGRVLAFNVADSKVGTRVVPLVDSTVRVVEEEGFDLDAKLWMPITLLNREGRAGEPVLVFRKR